MRMPEKRQHGGWIVGCFSHLVSVWILADSHALPEAAGKTHEPFDSV